MIRRGDGLKSRILLWAKRFGLFCLGLGVLIVSGLCLLMSDGDNYFQKKISNKFMSTTAEMGYRIDNILVEGRVNTDAQAVLDLIGVKKGDPIFSVNPAHIKENLDKIKWIKTAHVERRLPDTVYVRLEERTPFALWQQGGQKDGKLILIDSEGFFLSDKNLNKFKNLMMVRGDGAPVQVFELAQMIAAEPEIKSRLDHANRIESRRWDLVLKDGKVIKLPEKDIGFAMRNLVVSHNKEGLLDKPLTTIDVRDPERLIVRTEIGKAQDFSINGAQQGQSL